MRIRNKVVLQLFVVVALVAFSAASFAATGTTVSPDQALSLLMKGNKHFVRGELEKVVENSSPADRTVVAAGQHPYAIILTCSDSRVPPEILFDKGLGEIFVIRVAGNVVAPHELGSIEYAVEHLSSSLIMVLGHERCGAVTAAFDAKNPVEGNLGSIVESIMPAVVKTKAAGGDVEMCITENIHLVMKELEDKSPVIKEFVENNSVKIVGAKYDLDSGVVELLEE